MRIDQPKFDHLEDASGVAGGGVADAGLVGVAFMVFFASPAKKRGTHKLHGPDF